LGITDGYLPRFVKAYAHLSGEIRQAAMRYRQEVRDGIYPDSSQSFK
jgi:3-methyl-2-oxobutanoate hydroxymethyltransferase